jgi:hypothetical protein
VSGQQLTHEAPESEGEELGQGVEGQVAARALGVVVGAGELCAGRREGTTGDDLVGHGGHAHGGSGQHLDGACQWVVLQRLDSRTYGDGVCE